jgi:DNA-binding CsgD family transcriptional regulator
MPGFTISARETSLLADVAAAAREPSESPLGWPVLEQLRTLLHAESVTLAVLDSALPRFEFFQWLEPSGEHQLVSETASQAEQNPFWASYWDPDKGCSYADRRGDYDWVRRSSDTQSLRQRRASVELWECEERLIQARRQVEVLRMVRAGLTNRQIARRVGVSEGTVNVHLQNVYERLDVRSRTAAVHKVFDETTVWCTTLTPTAN